MIVLLLAAASASAPDAAPALLGSVDGLVEHLAVESGGRLVTAINGSSVLGIDASRWTTDQAAPCNATDAAPGKGEDDVIPVYVACDDGTVAVLAWEDGGFSGEE